MRALLFTDIEGSTRRWELHGADMPTALARHDEIVRTAVERNGGRVFKHLGDGVAAVFPSVDAAAGAAVEAQLRLGASTWPPGCELRARMGIHAGPLIEQGDDFFGATVNRAAWVMGAAHGGQVLVSEVGRDLRARRATWLVTEMGRHQLRDLAEPTDLFQLRVDGMVEEFPPLRTLDAYPSNLPHQLSTLVGRDHNAETVLEDLARSRLVSIVGAAGMGKTRLSQYVAAESLPRYAAGAWFVDISAAESSDDIVVAVASVLGVRLRASEPWSETFAVALGAAKVLVVLDNCEHVVEAVADVVEHLVQAVPSLTVLATSREPIGVHGERVHRVSGLPDAAAVALFCERADAARGEGQLDPDDPALAELCRRLDGAPLAIELAAARARALAPQEILDRLNDRFRILAGSGRRAERHQTLRVAIDWSYALLGESSQLLLDRLGVFAGGFDLAAAEHVCAFGGIEESEVLDLVEGLVDKSFVVMLREGARSRYRLLEMVSDYAAAKAEERGETRELRERHARYFVEQGRLLAARINGGDLAGGAADIRSEFDNIRRTLDWLGPCGWLEEKAELACSLVLFWTTLAHTEGLRRLDELLALGDALEPKLRIEVMVSASSVSVQAGSIRRANDLLHQAKQLAEEVGVSWPVNLVASQATIDELDGRPADAVRNCEALLSTPGAVDNAFLDLSVRLRMAASLVFVRPDESLAFAEDCLTRAEQGSIDLFIAASRLVLGLVHLMVTHDEAAARHNFERTIELAGDILPSASIPARCGLAILDLPAEPVTALRHMVAGLRAEMTVNEPVARSCCFDVAGAACVALGRADAARVLLGGGAFLRRSCGFGGYAWVQSTRSTAQNAGNFDQSAGRDELVASDAVALIEALIDHPSSEVSS